MLKATEHSCGRVEGPEVVEGGRGWGTSALLDVAQAAWKSLVLISRRFGQLFLLLYLIHDSQHQVVVCLSTVQ